MAHKHGHHISDWTQSWNGSIATKLTAIILWSVMIAAFILTVPIMLDYEEQRLKRYLWENHELVNLIETSINNRQSKSAIENQLQSYIKKNDTVYVSVKSENLNISVGDSSDNNYRFPTTRLFTESGQQVTIHIQYHAIKRVLLIDRIILGSSILTGAILFGLLIFLVTKNVIHNPMKRFVELTHRISKGENDVRFEEDRDDEFGELARFSNEMLKHLELQRKELVDINDELLTEIKNREVAFAASQQKGDFLANMSHEIRTPLSSIIGYTERLRYKNIKTQEEKNNMLDVVLQSSDHLLSLINDILDFSKIEADKLEVDPNNFSIFSTIEQTVHLLNDKALERANLIKVEYLFPIPKFIDNDATRTKQILLNLCGNALRFTKNGTITIQVSFDQTANRLEIAIKDTGIGMTDAAMDRLFKPFSQGDRTISNQFGGTGLGLVISKKLAELMGGDISVTSTKNEGSTFTFRIDAGFKPGDDILDEIDYDVIRTDKHDGPIEDFKLSGKVLLVEDTKEIRALIKAYLEDYGIDITTAENGKQGVEMALDGNYNAVLMDIQMPVMNGKEAVKLLRHKGYAKPVIALTADALKQQIEEYKTLGFTHILTKPIIINELLNVLSIYLDPGTTNDILNAVQTETLTSSEVLSEAGTEPALAPKVLNTVLDSEHGKRVINRFINELPEKIASLDVAIESHSIDRLKELFHQLKGVGGSVGFPIITQLATDIEAPLANEDYPGIINKVNELKVICSRISAHE